MALNAKLDGNDSEFLITPSKFDVYDALAQINEAMVRNYNSTQFPQQTQEDYSDLNELRTQNEQRIENLCKRFEFLTNENNEIVGVEDNLF